MKRSGCTEKDEVRVDSALLKGRKVNHPREGAEKYFRFLDRRKILRKIPKLSAKSPDYDSDSIDETKDADESIYDDKYGDKKHVGKSKRTEGRCKAKGDAAMVQVRAKRLKIMNAAVRFQEQ